MGIRVRLCKAQVSGDDGAQRVASRLATTSPLSISTPFSDWLDLCRRMWWAEEGEPERPPHPDARFLKRHDSGPWGSRGQEGYSTYVDDNATGALTTPARGYTQDDWAKLSNDEQRAARQRQFDEDAAEQRAWEAKANAEAAERHERISPPSSRT